MNMTHTSILLENSPLDEYLNTLPDYTEFDCSVIQRYAYPPVYTGREKKKKLLEKPLSSTTHNFFIDLVREYDLLYNQYILKYKGINCSNAVENVEKPVNDNENMSKYKHKMLKDSKFIKSLKDQFPYIYGQKKNLYYNSYNLYFVIISLVCMQLIKKNLLYTTTVIFLSTIVFSKFLLQAILKFVLHRFIYLQLFQISSTNEAILTRLINIRPFQNKCIPEIVNHVYLWNQKIIHSFNRAKYLSPDHENHSIEHFSRIISEVSLEVNYFLKNLKIDCLRYMIVYNPFKSYILQHFYPLMYAITLILFKLLPIAVILKLAHLRLHITLLNLKIIDEFKEDIIIESQKPLKEMIELLLLTLSNFVKCTFINIPQTILAYIHYICHKYKCKVIQNYRYIDKNKNIKEASYSSYTMESEKNYISSNANGSLESDPKNLKSSKLDISELQLLNLKRKSETSYSGSGLLDDESESVPHESFRVDESMHEKKIKKKGVYVERTIDKNFHGEIMTEIQNKIRDIKQEYTIYD